MITERVSTRACIDRRNSPSRLLWLFLFSSSLKYPGPYCRCIKTWRQRATQLAQYAKRIFTCWCTSKTKTKNLEERDGGREEGWTQGEGARRKVDKEVVDVGTCKHENREIVKHMVGEDRKRGRGKGLGRGDLRRQEQSFHRNEVFLPVPVASIFLFCYLPSSLILFSLSSSLSFSFLFVLRVLWRALKKRLGFAHSSTLKRAKQKRETVREEEYSSSPALVEGQPYLTLEGRGTSVFYASLRRAPIPYPSPLRNPLTSSKLLRHFAAYLVKRGKWGFFTLFHIFFFVLSSQCRW